MTDRDLLELAASAAGKLRAEWDYEWLLERGVSVSRDMLWNPLVNSGEALELAVLLDFDIVSTGEVVFIGNQKMDEWLAAEAFIDDKLAATRRAITRAAAATVAA